MKLKLKLKDHPNNQNLVKFLGFIYNIYISGYLEIQDENIENQLLNHFNQNKSLLPYIGPRRLKKEDSLHEERCRNDNQTD